LSGFEKIFYEKIHVGDLLKLPGCLVFFGTRFGTAELLETIFPEIQFCKLKQVHGKIVVAAEASVKHEGDGHWTSQENLALSIVTADCLPILGVSDSGKYVFAVHAGWRGVNLNILEVALAKVPADERASFKLYVGPHIFKNSFEVGLDVAKLLAAGAADHPSDKSKALVDLFAITKLQAAAAGISADKIFNFGQNTFTNENYASYRRDKPNAGRQISFICKA